jgi:hypothetical protein
MTSSPEISRDRDQQHHTVLYKKYVILSITFVCCYNVVLTSLCLLGQKIASTCRQAKAKFVQADSGEVRQLPLLLLCQKITSLLTE